MTDLGSETSPLSMTGEQWVLETRTNDPAAPAPDERWIRTDLNEGDRVATLMCGDGTEIPLFPVGLAEETVREARRFNVGGETVFAPLAPLDDASFPERRFQHDGQLHAFHDRVAPGSAILDSENLHADHDPSALNLSDQDTASTFPDVAGSASDLSAVGGPTFETNVYGDEPAILYDATDDAHSAGSTDWGTLTQPVTVYIVLSPDSQSLYGVMDHQNDAERHLARGEEDGEYGMDSGSYLSAGTGFGAGNAIWSIRFDGTNSLMRDTGTEVLSGNAGTNSKAGMLLGAHEDYDGSLTNYYGGHIGRALVYDTGHNFGGAGTGNEVEQYLSDKYGIAL